MVQPNPRHSNDIQQHQPGIGRQPSDFRSSFRDPRVHWGFVYSAVLSLITFALLFQPWLTTKGPKGRATSDAFGRIQGNTPSAAEWEADGLHPVQVTGGGGIVAATAAVTTILAVVMYLFNRRTTTALLILGSSAVQALSVFCTLLYLGAKIPEFKTLSETSSSSGGLFSGGGQGTHGTASADLGYAAVVGGITALGAVVVAVVTSVPKRAGRRTLAPTREITAPPTTRAIESGPPAATPRAPHATRHLPAPEPSAETDPSDESRTRTPQLEGLTIRLPYHSTLVVESRSEFAALVGSGARR